MVHPLMDIQLVTHFGAYIPLAPKNRNTQLHQSLMTTSRVTYLIYRVHTGICVSHTYRKEKLERGYRNDKVE